MRKSKPVALLTFRKYALHRGVSVETVSKAVERGRITTVTDYRGRRMIDPEVADPEWEANTMIEHKTTPTRREREELKNSAQKKSAESTDLAALDDDPGAVNDPSVSSPNYAHSRALREAYNARLARLEYEERKGKLISVEKVRSEAYKLAKTVRDAILNVPDRIANELASYDEPAKIHERLTQELILALEELVNGKKR